ncbi:MAG TPA: ABC transporter ATP-binding protein [Ruminococcaceae bacterium]|nr:ABC transporter ATP-binding protein [Oscillospiraceae bacterium]
MKVILKYIKPFAFILLLCVLLLFGQAISDLSLPNLMSDIVNVGLQKNGIDEPMPEQISEQGMEMICLFLSEEEKNVFQSAYEKKDGVYLLPDGKAPEEAQKTYRQSALTIVNAAKAAASQNGLTQSTSADLSGIDGEALYQMLPMLKNMPKQMVQQAYLAASQADDSLKEQVATAFTALLYQDAGVDLHQKQQNYILLTGGKMLLVALAGVLAAVGVGFFSARIGAAVSRDLRHDIFQKVESFSSGEFDRFSTASLITRTTNDVQQVQMLITMGIRLMCYAPIMGIGGIVMAVGKSVSLSWIIALAVVVLIGLIMIIFAIAMPKFQALQKLIDRLNLVSRENLSGLMVIRAFGNEKYEENRFEKANRDLQDTTRFVQRTMAFAMPAMNLVMNLVTLVIIWVGGHAIAASTMQIGDMMAFMQYGMQIMMSFLMIAAMFIMVPRAAVSADRVAEVLNTDPGIQDPKTPVQAAVSGGTVEFRKVSFRYQNAESDVLSDLNFTAKAGETTAFIGSTGAGKSTLLNLIPRFYDVTEGSVSIGGVDVRQMTQKQLRQIIGYVPQKSVLFSGNIASNIRYGKEDASDEEIWEALRIAQAEDFVRDEDGDLSASIAQGGQNVSGGQRQRLAIARALARKPLVYLFDDSFSALDFKTDAALRSALQKKLDKNAAVLIVAQRVSTIMRADQIIVLDHGRIVGKGTHGQLLKNCPEYLEIAQSQLSKEELQ